MLEGLARKVRVAAAKSPIPKLGIEEVVESVDLCVWANRGGFGIAIRILAYSRARIRVLTVT